MMLKKHLVFFIILIQRTDMVGGWCNISSIRVLCHVLLQMFVESFLVAQIVIVRKMVGDYLTLC